MGIIQKSASYLFTVVSDLCSKGSDHSLFLAAFAVRNETLLDQFINKEIQLKYTKSGQLDISFSQGMWNLALLLAYLPNQKKYLALMI